MTLRNIVNYTQYRGNTLTTAPAVEPVTADELRAFLREGETGLPDSEAADFIGEAREYIEEMTGLALINQSWTMTLDQWPQSANGGWWDGVRDGSISEIFNPANLSSVYLPRYPLSSVTSITTYAENSDATVITVADVFNVDTQQRPGRVTLKPGQAWPVALQANNAIEIEYVAGYGATAVAVPYVLKRAVKQLAAALYTNRGDGCGCGDVYTSSGAASLVGVYDVRRI